MNPYYQHGPVTLYQGDSLEVLRSLPEESVQCVVTSPPYWGLRDYGTAKWEGGDATCDHKQGRNGAGRADGIVDERGQRNRDGVGSMGGNCPKCGATRIDSQMGLESAPEAYTARMVEVFREVRRVLRKDGTMWLNVGDSYSANQSNNGGYSAKSTLAGFSNPNTKGRVANDQTSARRISSGLKPKDLVGIPWRLAFALQADGWYLRSDIIWAKPNPMPESCTDRPTKSHEYLFLMSKSERYHYDQDSIREPHARLWDEKNGGNLGSADGTDYWQGAHQKESRGGTGPSMPHPLGRNRRSVWTIPTQSFPESHFATYPTKLVEPCILAGCPKGGIVMDPFSGSGTTGLVAIGIGRKYIGIELNPEYLEMSKRRIFPEGDLPLWGEKPESN